MKSNKHLKIVSAQYKIGNCMMSNVVGEVQLEDEKGKIVFYTNSEVDSMPCFMKTKDSIIDMIVDEKEEDEERIAELTNNGESFLDYDDLSEMRKTTKYYIYMYLTYLVRASVEDADQFIKDTVGKYLDEIEIPEYHDEDEEEQKLDSSKKTYPESMLEHSTC